MTESVDGPLDHLRRAMPPWWTGPELTECGRLATDVQSIVDRPAMKAKFAKQGKQRASFSTCMTCANLYQRPGSWDRFPIEVLHRALEGSRYRMSPRREGGEGEVTVAERTRRELLALGMLAGEHREEFERLVEAIGQTENLDDARRRARLRRVQ